MLQPYRKYPSTTDSIPKPSGERVGFLASHNSLGVVTDYALNGTMKSIYCLASLVVIVLSTLTMVGQTYVPQDYPQMELSNGILRAKFYLPDANKGFYRGTRFDWAGVIGSLEYKGHDYLAPFFEKFDTSVADVEIANPIRAGINSAASGPVEEFIGADGTALGYAEAKPGETFCKIGVGSLRKINNEAYSSYTNYSIVNGGKRGTKSGADWIGFTQELECGSGYAYRYEKTIRFVKNESLMEIEHRLLNTGKRVIETMVYDHNFLSIDHLQTGPSIVISFPFSPRATQDMGGLGEIRGKQLLFSKDLRGSDTFYTELTGFGKDASDYEIRVENQRTGAGVLITGDRPLATVGLWAVRTVVAPEPYIAIHVPVGQEFRWTYRNRFYVNPTTKKAGSDH
jgi:hypothetical protein